MHSPPLWLKNINEPVHAANLCQFLWRLHRREIFPTMPIFDSHRRITLQNHELFRIKCPFYDPRPSFALFLFSLPPLPLPFPLSLSLSPYLYLSSSHIYLIWIDCTTTAIKRLAQLRHFQILTGRRSTLYNSRQKEDLIVQYRVFGEGGVTFLMCRNAHLISQSCSMTNFEIFYNYL